ncbi:hypothetical protein ASR50_21775 [Streptomyces sp. 4F]|nr:hypothetical protein ASR50_21775 [Streptomyces sp. 4F]
MPVPSEAPRNRVGLPTVGLAAARELVRTAESSDLGRPGTDELFDRWLDESCDIAFYRGADRSLQARAVGLRDDVPDRLSNSRVGHACLGAVCLNPHRPASDPAAEEPTSDADTDGTDEADERDGITVCCMPGLCWDCGVPKERYAKLDGPRDDEDELDDFCVLYIVDENTGGLTEGPSYDLSGELPSDLSGRSLRGLTVLTDTAGRKLVTEEWDTGGPWHLWWTSCGSDVTELLGGAEGTELSGRGADEAEETTCYVTVQKDGDGHTVEVLDVRGAEAHVTYEAPVAEPDGAPQDTETLEGLRNLLERAADQVREAGYGFHGDWTVNWTECRVLLTD